VDIKETRLRNTVTEESLLWGEDVADTYHNAAARDMERLWESVLYPYFSRHKFDLSRAIDFAAGYGRNTRKLLAEGAGHVTMVDVNVDCINHLKTAFQDDNTAILQVDGLSLIGLDSGGYSFLYTFDAMVHFDLEIVISYLFEFNRVLQDGAYALVHHSNYTGSPGEDFRKNPHWRNFMDATIFKHIARRAGFEIVEQNTTAWGGIEGLDCITILRKSS
jgi:ubiquinone/menaquinone biosynthesis C-methylase UbiE